MVLAPDWHQARCSQARYSQGYWHLACWHQACSPEASAHCRPRSLGRPRRCWLIPAAGRWPQASEPALVAASAAGRGPVRLAAPVWPGLAGSPAPPVLRALKPVAAAAEVARRFAAERAGRPVPGSLLGAGRPAGGGRRCGRRAGCRPRRRRRWGRRSSPDARCCRGAATPDGGARRRESLPRWRGGARGRGARPASRDWRSCGRSTQRGPRAAGRWLAPPRNGPWSQGRCPRIARSLPYSSLAPGRGSAAIATLRATAPLWLTLVGKNCRV